MSDIKKGDCVQLKSGGPVMTVAEVGDYAPKYTEDGATCVWFDESKPMEKIFAVATLEIVEE